MIKNDRWPSVTVIYELVYCFGKVYICKIIHVLPHSFKINQDLLEFILLGVSCMEPRIMYSL
jgi:hypothetical protein